jgi:acetyl-CoA C-acetyltransferase
MLVVVSEKAVDEESLEPMGRILSWAVAGVDPDIMGIGPVPSSRLALKRAGLSLDDVDLIEINEAFAAQTLADGRELGFDWDKVNVNGGAIALGHPIGASGARIVATLLHELRRREGRYGLATLCLGGGGAVAAAFERVD